MIGPRPIHVLAIALLVLGCPRSGEAQSRPSAPRRALLVIGADAVKGLPFFSPNAIAALSGTYSLGGAAGAGTAPGPTEATAAPGSAGAGALVRVWYTREAVVLGSAWKRFDLGGGAAYSLMGDKAQIVSRKGSAYSLFFELPLSGAPSSDAPQSGAPASGSPLGGASSQGAASGAALAAGRAFALAFDVKFRAFFENAPSEAELSFPAFVDY